MSNQRPKVSTVGLSIPSSEAPPPPPARSTRPEKEKNPLSEWSRLNPTETQSVKEGGELLNFFVPGELGMKARSIVHAAQGTGPIECIDSVTTFFAKAAYDYLTPLIRKRGALYVPPHKLPAGRAIRPTPARNDIYRTSMSVPPLLASQIRGFLWEQQGAESRRIGAMWELFTDAGEKLAKRLIDKYDIPLIQRGR